MNEVKVMHKKGKSHTITFGPFESWDIFKKGVCSNDYHGPQTGIA